MDSGQRFMDAFEGFSEAHGETKISNERRQGKQAANSYIKRTPLTIELINGHLQGGLGVGSIPINEENKCKFGALDIDTYPIDHVAVDKKLQKLKTVADGNDKGSWYSWQIEKVGMVDSLEVYNDCKEFHKSVASGEVKATAVADELDDSPSVNKDEVPF